MRPGLKPAGSPASGTMDPKPPACRLGIPVGLVVTLATALAIGSSVRGMAVGRGQ